MKELEIFYLTHCPYCINAKKAVEELKAENPLFESVGVRWIEESREPELAARRDYYNVPSVFLEDQKLYEAKPGHSFSMIKESLRRAFETALSR